MRARQAEARTARALRATGVCAPRASSGSAHHGARVLIPQQVVGARAMMRAARQFRIDARAVRRARALTPHQVAGARAARQFRIEARASGARACPNPTTSRRRCAQRARSAPPGCARRASRSFESKARAASCKRDCSTYSIRGTMPDPLKRTASNIQLLKYAGFHGHSLVTLVI